MKSTFLYLLLVGVPIVILIGVVHIGERITPPPYVGGTWVIMGTEEMAADGCIPKANGDRPLRLVVAQSGTVLELSFRSQPRMQASARFRDGVIRAKSIPTPRECGIPLALEATPLGTDRLSGRWFVPGCDTCAVVPFEATRPAMVTSVTATTR